MLRANNRNERFIIFILVILTLLKDMNMQQVIEKFQRRLMITKRPATVQYYQFYFHLMKKYLGDLDIKLIDEDVLLNFIVTLKQHHPRMKNITINKVLSALKTTLKYGANQVINITRLSESKTLIPLIPPSTINQILDSFKKYIHRPIQLRNYLIVKILLETGLRMNELIHLQKHHVDFQTQTIMVEMTKTHAHRIVCFLEETQETLQAWMSLHPSVPELFYNLKTKRRMTSASIESLFLSVKETHRC